MTEPQHEHPCRNQPQNVRPFVLCFGGCQPPPPLGGDPGAGRRCRQFFAQPTQQRCAAVARGAGPFGGLLLGQGSHAGQLCRVENRPRHGLIGFKPRFIAPNPETPVHVCTAGESQNVRCHGRVAAAGIVGWRGPHRDGCASRTSCRGCNALADCRVRGGACCGPLPGGCRCQARAARTLAGPAKPSLALCCASFFGCMALVRSHERGYFGQPRPVRDLCAANDELRIRGRRELQKRLLSRARSGGPQPVSRHPETAHRAGTQPGGPAGRTRDLHPRRPRSDMRHRGVVCRSARWPGL